jgi:dTDP-4-amino-4,6-dideoxygalactose transaminase
MDVARRRAEAQADVGADADFFRTIDLQTIPMPNGVLGVAEVSKHIGFPVHRAYYIKEVPTGHGRGGHGHRQLRQCFLCLRGTVTLKVTKHGRTVERRLGLKPEAAIVAAGCWRDLSDFSEDSVVIVLASAEYDEADYIRDYQAFEQWEAGAVAPAQVPYLDLRRYSDEVGPEIELALRRVLQSGQLIGGDEVGRFESAFADYCETAGAVGMGNGLDALAIALRAWGIGPGDEVIVPAHTFIATALAVDEVGATPVLADVEADTGLIDPDAVARAITPRTRAVIPVHLYGHPADMDRLKEVIAGRDIRLLEDACQAHGARYRRRRCGALGDAAAFSFYPTKNLGALGDGGALTSQEPAFLSLARSLGNYGAAEKYNHVLRGRNSRLDPIQAAALSVKLPRLDQWNARRAAHALRYFAGLAGLSGLELPAVRSWAEPVWHVFPIRVAGRRDELQAWLAEQGVGTNIHYPTPLHLQPCYEGRWRSGDYPNAERLASSLLSLPLDPTHTTAEIDLVIRRVREFFAS